MTREQLEATFITSPTYPGQISQTQLVDGIEDYLFIGGDGMSAQQAADRLGVSRRTVERWRKTLKTVAGAS